MLLAWSDCTDGNHVHTGNTMAVSYYIDESGHSGDLIKSGNALDFGGQPFFSLACVGVDDETRLDREITRLKSKYRIASAELKSAHLKSNPALVLDLVEFVCGERLPFFIEVVDKKYFLCAEIVNWHVLPPTSRLGIDFFANVIRNKFADYLYDHAHAAVFEKFIAACAVPCEQTLRESFNTLLSLTERDRIDSDVAYGIHINTAKSFNGYDNLKQKSKDAHLQFLPLPDYGKRSKVLWMLPNLSSFCNIYARINLYHGGNLTGVRMIHDKQKHLDGILERNKQFAESLLKDGDAVYTPHANYRFTQSVPLSFAESDRSSGIQTADVLAGFTVRHFKERVTDANSINPTTQAAFDKLLEHSDPANGVGMNLVVPSRLAVLPEHEQGQGIHFLD